MWLIYVSIVDTVNAMTWLVPIRRDVGICTSKAIERNLAQMSGMVVYVVLNSDILKAGTRNDVGEPAARLKRPVGDVSSFLWIPVSCLVVFSVIIAYIQ